MANGDPLAIFSAQHHEPASLSTQAPQLAVIGSRLTLAYDPSVEELAHFRSYLSTAYAGGGIRADIWWLSTTTSTQLGIWGMAVERSQEAVSDLATDNYDTEKTLQSPAPGVANALRKASFPFTTTEIDSVAAGEPFRIRLARKATSTGDELTVDAHFYQMYLVETT